MHAPSHNSPVLPLAALIFAATMWGLFWLPLRWLEAHGLQGVWITFLIYSGTLVYCIPISLRRHSEFRVSPALLFAIALSSGWCNTAFILGMLEGEVVRVILLFYLSPVWATLLARWILKERVSKTAYLTLLIALGGAMLMLWTPEVGYPWPASRADWYGMTAGIAFALMNLFVHMTRKVSLQIKTVSAWYGVIVLAGAFLLFAGELPRVTTSHAYVYAFLIGIVLLGGMTWSIVYGVTHMPVHRSAIILLFEVVVAGVSTYLLTEERMGMLEWLGGLIVMFGAYLAARQQPQIIVEEKPG